MAPAGLHALTLLAFLKSQAVTHLVGLPDNASASLFSALQTDPDIDLVKVTREGEAFAVAAGLWVGGAVPVVIIQNTGFLESGDALRGTAVRMGIPLPFFVTYRGHTSLLDHQIDPNNAQYTRDLLVQPAIDSAALLTEPTLNAWGIPYHRMESDDDVDQLETAFGAASGERRPVAILLTHALS